MHRQQSFADWLRTGRGQSGRIEVKFNPWHDPDDGKFTFRNSGSFFGEGGSTDFAQRPRRDDPRVLAIGRAKRREGAKDKPTISTFRPGGGSFGGAGASGNWDGPIRRPAKAASAVATLHGALRLARPIIRSPAPTPTKLRTPISKSPEHRLPQGWRKDTRRGYTFVQDEGSRTRDVSGSLRLEPGIRDKRIQLEAGKPDRKPTDEGGHYIGVQFDGPREEFNHFAQDRNFNRSRYQKLERKWANALRSGKKVHVRIKVLYETTSRRPDKLAVTSTISGSPTYEELNNEPGQ